MKPDLFSKKISFKTKGRIFGFGSSPKADWKVIFLTFTSIALLGVILNAYIFLKIDKGEIFAVEEGLSGEGRMINVKKLESTVEYYEKKAAIFSQIQSNASTTVVSDPSL